MEKIEVKEAKGKLGILVVGVGGAVLSTFITGTLAVRKGLAVPIFHYPAGYTCESRSYPLSFYFKSPMHDFDHILEHDLFIQHTKMKNTLRKIIGEEILDYLD